MTHLTQVPDIAVWHAWGRDGVELVRVPPTFYEEAGTPIDEETGEDMEYLATYLDVVVLIEQAIARWGKRRDHDDG